MGHVGPHFIIAPIYGHIRIYGTGSVKILKTRHKISVDIRLFFQCLLGSTSMAEGTTVMSSDAEELPVSASYGLVKPSSHRQHI